jgi:GTPase Era involved in 16S rRNA processing
MEETNFEFNFAIVGTVSSGKSTFLNAIFSNMLSPCKRKRTTMCPQIYKLSNISDISDDLNSIFQKNQELNSKYESIPWTLSSLDSIIEYNALVPPDFVNFNITDYNIRIIDIPGLNDALTKDNYFHYIKHCFEQTFNIIFYLIDINSGLNTSDEITILELLLDNMKKYEHVELIVIINKIDYMEYDQDNDNLRILDEELNDIYHNQIKKTISKKMTEYNIDESRISYQLFSAQNCQLYREIKHNYQNINLDEYVKLPHVENLVISEIGKTKYSKLNPQAKINALKTQISNILDDEETYQINMNTSGFTSLKNKIKQILENNHFMNRYYSSQMKPILDNLNYTNIYEMISDTQISNTKTKFEKFCINCSNILNKLDNSIDSDNKSTYKKLYIDILTNTLYGSPLIVLDKAKNYIKLASGVEKILKHISGMDLKMDLKMKENNLFNMIMKRFDYEILYGLSDFNLDDLNLFIRLYQNNTIEYSIIDYYTNTYGNYKLDDDFVLSIIRQNTIIRSDISRLENLLIKIIVKDISDDYLVYIKLRLKPLKQKLPRSYNILKLMISKYSSNLLESYLSDKFEFKHRKLIDGILEIFDDVLEDYSECVS